MLMNDKIKVLMLQENETDAEIILHWLRKKYNHLDYSRVTCFDDLITELKDREWDVILSNYSMPSLTLTNATRLVMEMELDIPFIVISDKTDEDQTIESIEIEWHSLLHKSNLSRLCPLIDREVKSSIIRKESRLKEIELKKSEEALKLREERYRLCIECTNDGIWDWDLINNHIYYSIKWKEMLGYRDEEIEDTIGTWKDLIHPEDIHKVFSDLNYYLNNALDKFGMEYRLKCKNGEYKWIRSCGKVIRAEDSKPLRLVGSNTDISYKKYYEEKVHRMAYYDLLTGMPNRTLFEEKMGEHIKAAALRNEAGAILFLDLDNFKNVNDIFGHALGDELLKNVAELLNVIVTDGEVFRFGGDLFVLLLEKIPSREYVINIAENIIKSFQNPWVLSKAEFYNTISIGISIYPEDGTDVVSLFKNADAALNNAKESGRNLYKLYHPSMNSKNLEKLEMEKSLRKALKNKEFMVFYQPQIDLYQGKIIGVEALIRWNHPFNGMVPPIKFIPFAEELGLIVPIGEWVLREACRQNKLWQDMGYEPVKVSVNLSARQFQQQNLKEIVQNILNETKLEPQWLDLEITETIAMNNLDITVKTLEELSELGVSLSLDDFGTGYSSLNYLKVLPINTVKMDKTFVNDMTNNLADEAIAQAVIIMAHKMNLMVTAEGVETEDQLMFLRKQSCDNAQGYLFSKPINADGLEQLLKNGVSFIEWMEKSF